ncbi:hypothetical protein RND81_05G023200 [Saponaria officinalis]|uniref:Uncharacterized protein n=1 Tax=Saponaria officinalis TaxID=3572 RepID=A0AAW1KWX8_SAPOF
MWIVSVKLGKLSVGSVKLPARNGLDDLLTFGDGGKHDYDWLLTPPETPLSIERSDFQSNLSAPRKTTVTRSTSTTKPSRLSTSQSESSYPSRPARSSSVTRSSVASALNNGYSSNRSSSILNTSSASVSSYIRPSSPITRSSSAAARPSTPSRTISSRSSTPSRSRSASIVSSTDRSRPSQSSRPSTPSSRPQAPANLSSFPTTRSNSRPSTPTRRSTITTSASTPNISISNQRGPSISRSQTSTSRPSSPSPKIRPQQPAIPPDFPLDTPPNLRTSLSDRPVSAGRSRPGAALSSKVTTDTTAGNLSRRPSSPVKSRGRSVEAHGRGHLHSNGQNVDTTESRKSAYISDAMKKSVKSSTTTENGGFGRTISKKSLDMAIRHMDVRNGSGSMRPLPNTSLFPQSIRSGPSKIQSGHGSGSPTSIQSNGSPSFSSNGSILENGPYANNSLEIRKKVENGRFYGRLTEVDMYESTRYDAILLKEDLKNTTWLHSMDDKSDQMSIFDNGSESLPEPFGPS